MLRIIRSFCAAVYAARLPPVGAPILHFHREPKWARARVAGINVLVDWAPDSRRNFELDVADGAFVVAASASASAHASGSFISVWLSDMSGDEALRGEVSWTA